MMICQGAEDTAPALIRTLQPLVFDLEHGPASLGDIASRLALSERTLRRRLRALGTSYSEILQHVRSATAKAWLHDGRLTMESIAWRLGYTETANFRHAFKRWTGQSPQAFRRQLPGGRQTTDATSPRHRHFRDAFAVGG